MRALVLETDPGAADAAIGLLEGAGHEIVRCHEPGDTSFPCRALHDGGCPLDAGGVDVALVVRSPFYPRPTTLEDGVPCALRHRVPVVVAGSRMRNPYADWVDESIDGVDDVVPVCERTANTARGHAAAARAAIDEYLIRAGRAAGSVDVEAERHGRRVQVVLRSPDELGLDDRNRFGVVVHQALRVFDPFAEGFDVAVHAADSAA